MSNSNTELTNEELLKLDNQLCFALYVASKEVIKKYKPLLSKVGLTYTGYITMLALWENDNVKVKELGERLYLDSGTLTPLLKKLEKQGYLKRNRGLTDERIVYIKLTQKGIELKKEAADIPNQMVCKLNSDMDKIVALRDSIKDFLTML